MHPFESAARQSAQAMQDSLDGLQREHESLEQQLKTVSEKIRHADQAVLRAHQYKSAEGLCPSCWVQDGEPVQLKTVASESGSDEFECPQCFCSFEIRQ
jgi:DNA repair exonuclease SbcCD ATPase subunit